MWSNRHVDGLEEVSQSQRNFFSLMIKMLFKCKTSLLVKGCSDSAWLQSLEET